MTFIKKYLNIDVENVNCTKIMSKLSKKLILIDMD